jgi:2-methylisocitrate lyase-like PEP mutase family enzyme
MNAAVQPSQLEKGRVFRALHQRESTFIIPNPWDVGSARLLAHFGFEALATTSMGYAFSRGRLDNSLDREETLAYASRIVSATHLPVSADLENGFGDSPEVVAETIRLAAKVGLVGASIEDATGEPDRPIYELDRAIERVRAGAEAAHSLPLPFTLTARAENYLRRRPDIRDTVRRLQAYQEAGADVLYAPGLTTREEIATVVSSVNRPVNVVMGLQGVQLTLAELSGIGVRRVSVGSALYRTAIGAFMRAAQEMQESGSFSFAGHAATPQELSRIMR